MFKCSVLVACVGVVLAMVASVSRAQVETTTETRERVTTTIREYETIIREVQKDRAEPLLAAIFIKNRAQNVDDQKTRVMEDMVIGEITDAGIRVVSPEDTVTALRRFLQTEEERERTREIDRSRVVDENRLMSQAVDRMLEDSTSALRLAQNMQVDYIIIASITSYGQETNRVSRPDLNMDRTVTTHRLRTMYKVLDIARGGSETAGNIVSERRTQQDNRTPGGVRSETVFDDLLADAAAQMGGQLGRKIAEGRVRERDPAADMVRFIVTCGMQDMSVPEIIRDEEGRYVITGNNYKLEAMAVTVELNGVVIGSAPGTFEAFPGLHRIRLTREGFSPWERNINLARRSDGDPMVLQVALQLDETGRRRWVEDMERLNRMKRDQALTDAEVKLVEGLAEMFRNTQIRIDPKSVNIGTDEPRRRGSFWPF